MLEQHSTNNLSISDAALATLHVNDLSADHLLTLVVLTASPLQLEVVKASNKGDLKLVAKNGTLILTQRNAIIMRWITGLGFHNASDRANGFLGGYNDSVKASPSAAIAIAEISSWMSVADSIRSSSPHMDTSPDAWAQRIDEYLSCRAYLVSAAKPTLADYDVAFAFLQHSDIIIPSNFTHLQRWLTQVLTSALELVQKSSRRYAEMIRKKELLSDAATVFIQSLQRFRGMPHKTNHSHVFVYPKDMNVSDSISDEKQQSVQVSTHPGDRATKSKKLIDENSKPSSSETTKMDKKMDKKVDAKPAETSSTNLSNPSTKATSKLSNTKSSADANKDGNDSDFNISALDIRVGQIMKVWPHESADKLFCEEINVGEDQPRSIASGLRPFYSLEEMQNQRVLVLTNLKARNLVC